MAALVETVWLCSPGAGQRQGVFPFHRNVPQRATRPFLQQAQTETTGTPQTVSRRQDCLLDVLHRHDCLCHVPPAVRNTILSKALKRGVGITLCGIRKRYNTF